MMDAAFNVDLNALPAHVGIIMDGNGRWATRRKLPRTSGHNEGLKRAKDIAKAASDLGIKYLTLYVFSTENWKRTQQEVGFLMGLIHSHLRQELAFYKENQIRVNMIGDLSGLPSDVQRDIIEAREDTKSFSGTTVCLAINYGGRDEILRGIKKLSAQGFSMDEITEESFRRVLTFPVCRMWICSYGQGVNSGSAIFCSGKVHMPSLCFRKPFGLITERKNSLPTSGNFRAEIEDLELHRHE